MFKLLFLLAIFAISAVFWKEISPTFLSIVVNIDSFMLDVNALSNKLLFFLEDNKDMIEQVQELKKNSSSE